MRRSESPCVARPRHSLGQGLVALGLLSVACSPSLDWRELQPDAAGWRALMPCRPVQRTRRLAADPSGGVAVDWRLNTCQAEGVTFAIGDTDVADPARVPPVLQALKARAFAQGRSPAAEPMPFQMPGLTPQPDAGRWRLKGVGPDGKVVQIELALFAHGTRIVQATLIGPALSAAAVQPFFEALRFTP